MNIDRKYQIRALNPCSRNTHDEHDSILFLAKDKAVPAMLRAYLTESDKLGANPAHLESISLLIGRVEQYQREVEAKIPDTDLPCEIRRCVDGDGVSDNKQDLAPGAQPAPSAPEGVSFIDTSQLEGVVSTEIVHSYPSPSGWLRAIDEALVVTHLGVANAEDTYEQAKAKLDNLIGLHVDIATDPAVNGGWKLVSIEPTEEMYNAGANHCDGYWSTAQAVWDAMLAAAPEAKP